MRAVIKLLLLSSLSICSLTSIAATTNGSSKSESTPPDITGSYQCKGYDPGGNSNYTNPITVTKNGDTYAFQWLNSSGYPFNLGTGIMIPNLNNVVSVVFWDPKKSDYFGTMVYAIGSDGTLDGGWVIQGTKKAGTETCIKSK